MTLGGGEVDGPVACSLALDTALSFHGTHLLLHFCCQMDVNQDRGIGDSWNKTTSSASTQGHARVIAVPCSRLYYRTRGGGGGGGNKGPN